MTIDNAFVIFKNDFSHRNWIDWIKSHIMMAPPPYRFQGAISFTNHNLHFNGYDSQLKENVKFNIDKTEITQLYYGFDETFSSFQTRGMGITWAPIRITFDTNQFENETVLYLVAEFNGVFSENKHLYEDLKLWLS